MFNNKKTMKTFFISIALALAVLLCRQLPAARATDATGVIYQGKAIYCGDTVPRGKLDSIPGNKKVPDTAMPRRDSAGRQ